MSPQEIEYQKDILKSFSLYTNYGILKTLSQYFSNPLFVPGSEFLSETAKMLNRIAEENLAPKTNGEEKVPSEELYEITEAEQEDRTIQAEKLTDSNGNKVMIFWYKNK